MNSKYEDHTPCKYCGHYTLKYDSVDEIDDGEHFQSTTYFYCRTCGRHNSIPWSGLMEFEMGIRNKTLDEFKRDEDLNDYFHWNRSKIKSRQMEFKS